MAAPPLTKHAFSLRFFNLFHSKNALFHLFIFLIGLSIGFVLAFYLYDVFQSSLYSIFYSLLLLPISSSNTSISSILPPTPTPPPTGLPLPYEDKLSLLTPQPIPATPTLSAPTPPPMELSLPNEDSLSSLAPQPIHATATVSPQPPPPSPTGSSLPLAESLSSLAPQPIPVTPTSSPPLPLPPTERLSSLAPQQVLEASNVSPPLPSPPIGLPSQNEDSFSSLAPQLVPATQTSTPSPSVPVLPQEDSLLSKALQPISAPPVSPPIEPPLPHEDTLSTSSISQPLLLSPNGQIPRMHNMSDEDLVATVKKISTMSAPNAPYKVAFMFLTPGPLPLLPLWELFFKGHEGLFSIYIHPHPSYNDTIPQDSVFHDTRITSQPVYWGDISMVDAEKRLLANALLDPLNQRFVLLSDSCIPLFNFTTVYNYLINSNLSYIASFDDKRKTGRGRYNPQMAPNITIQDWRKGSQWFEVSRDLAHGIAVEQKYYNLFKEYCHPPCYNDEHYFPTTVNILYGKMNSNRSVTYVDWSKPSPHPRKFVRNDITEELLSSIRFGSRECVYNNNTTPMCWLFARKFAPNTLSPLLTFASLLFGSNP